MTRVMDRRSIGPKMEKPKSCNECVYRNTCGASACDGCYLNFLHKPGRFLIIENEEQPA
jgi:hypothetical protein